MAHPAHLDGAARGSVGSPLQCELRRAGRRSSAGTLRDELGGAGYTDVTTPNLGTSLPVRVNITLGSTTFTGVATTTYKATQGKGGSAVTVKPK